MGLCLPDEQSLVVFLRALFLEQFCSTCLSIIWMQELNAPLASSLMIPNWEVLLTLLRDKMACRGIWVAWSIWANINSMKLNKNKCQILHLGRSDGRHKSKLGEEWLESSPAEGVWGWQKAQQESAVCAQAAPGANRALECIKHSFTSHSKEEIVLLYLVLVWPHPECCVCFWAAQFQKHVKVPECIQRKAPKLWKGLAGCPVRSGPGHWGVLVWREGG